MPHFLYSGRNFDGRHVQGEVNAEDVEQAASRLQDAGVYVTAIVSKKAGVSRGPFRRRIILSQQERMLLLESWALFLEAGLSMQSTLMRLRMRSREPSVAAALEKIQNDVDEGASMTEALRQTPLFPLSWVSILEMGEKRGDIAPTLRILRHHSQEYERFKRDLVSMMIMPCVLLLLVMVWIAVFIFRVVPSMNSFLAQIGPVPSSQIMTVMSDAMIVILKGFFLLIFGLFFISLVMGRPDQEMGFVQSRIPLSTPIIGPILSQIQLIIIASGLQLQLEAGISLTDALRTLSHGVPSRSVHRQLTQACRNLEEGVSVPKALTQIRVIPSLGQVLVAAGSISGKLPEMFGFLSREAQSILIEKIKRLTVFIRVFVVLVSSLLVGLLMITFFQILFSGLSSIGSGQSPASQASISSALQK